MKRGQFPRLAKTMACLLLLLCVASQAAQAKDSQAAKKIVNIGWTNSANSLNPVDTAFAINSASNYPTELLFVPLVQLDNDMQYKYLLADSITTQDNRVFTVKLNPKAMWTDKVPVTADDVVFTVNTIANRKVGSTIAYLFNILEGTDSRGLYPDGAKGVSGVEKVNDKTVRFTTKEPVSISVFNDSVGKNLKTFPKHVFENVDPSTLSTNPQIVTPTVTDGPFTLIKFQSGQFIRLGANKDYFKGAPLLDELNIIMLTSSNISAQLISGEIDMNWPAIGNVPISDYEAIEKSPNLNVKKGTPYAIQVLWINNKTVPDARVRRAISLAIDRDLIANNLLKGYAEGLVLPFPSDSPYWGSGLVQHGAKVEEAKRLLAEAGWKPGTELTFRVPTGNVGRVSAAGVIVQNLRTVGITAKIVSADFATTVASVKQKLDYDLSILGISAPAADPSPILSQIFATGTAIGYSNAKLDQLITKAQNQTDKNSLMATYQEIQTILLNDMPATCVYVERALIAVNKRIIYGEPKEYGAFIDVQQWDVK